MTEKVDSGINEILNNRMKKRDKRMNVMLKNKVKKKLNNNRIKEN
jgi:hypothetical protein